VRRIAALKLPVSPVRRMKKESVPDAKDLAPVTLVDSNIFMYAAGKEHAFKDKSAGFLARVADGSVDATIDAEVLQEILHRYRVLGRWADGKVVYDNARIIFPAVLAITVEVIDRARILLDRYSDLMARDAVHAAVVEVHKLESICSFDRDFDRIRGVRRIEPK
jgi:predicted nucleic acid-binding protein